ncbi:hypothetical protein EUGRSUZ_L01806 [Eucalyptus grandis]|uniref:Hexosyltransferase n=1 Tax=Eucalyptus grandis TaxID=71139 RepID=A0A058ZTA0_EUCGR|nr:hypothetical protein EUGRSUZ_L01806 [Eucalyptus grandis]
MDPPPSYFNDSMFVFEPNITIYHTLFNILQNTLPSPIAMQECLETHFRDVYRPLSLEHNLALSMLWRHPEKVNLETVKVVHYCEAGTKPWRYTRQENTNNMQRGSIEMQVKQLCKFVVQEEIDALVKRWTDIYEDESLDYKNWIRWLMTALSLVCCQTNRRQTN